MLFRVCACVWLCASVGNGSLSYYQGNPEIGDSIRVGHVIQGWDPSSVYWLPSHPIRQNISSKPCRLHGLTRSFLDVHPRQTCSYGLNELSRLFQKYGFVRGDLHTLTRSLFFPSIFILTFNPDCCFHMNPCVIGVDISPARPSVEWQRVQPRAVQGCRHVAVAPLDVADGVICFCTLIQFCPQTRVRHLLSIAVKQGVGWRRWWGEV